MMHDLIPLSRLSSGSRAKVAEVVGTVEQVQRMREMGVCQGVELEMVQPGSPCIVRFGGHKLCIRSDDVLGVLVQVGRAVMSTLADLSVGAGGKVSRVAGDDEISVRLLEMGLTPGALVRVLGVAPLGDPIELEVRGYRLSVRRAEGARVEIETTI